MDVTGLKSLEDLESPDSLNTSKTPGLGGFFRFGGKRRIWRIQTYLILQIFYLFP